MDKNRINCTDDPMFEYVWKIYNYSFPACERRTIEHQKQAFNSPFYSLVYFKDKGEVVGFVGYWEFDEYLYIEHIAINKSCRGGGYGSKILREIQAATDKIIILEIDEVVDEVSERRLRFYERAGFTRNHYKHKGHIYREEEIVPMLEILTYPEAINVEIYNGFDSDLRNIVMKK